MGRRGAVSAVGAAMLTLLAGFAATPASASPPDQFGTVTVVSGLSPFDTAAFDYAPDGRIFIADLNGIVDVYHDGVVTPFIDLRGRPITSRNLRGLALDPNFTTNPRVYMLYGNGDNGGLGALVRVDASAADPNVADPSTLVTVMSDVPRISAHNAGGLEFDAAGRLLVSTGDGALDTLDLQALASQDLDGMYGKLFRIDPETGSGVADNPYYDPANPDSVRSRVLARGFRQPFRFSVDAVTGDIWVGDVGWNKWEELDRIPTTWSDPDRDLNFGWPCYEGGDGVALKQPVFAADPTAGPFCDTVYSTAEGGTGVGSAAPTWAYTHPGGGGDFGNAIIAGPVYRGFTYPFAFRNNVFVADFGADTFTQFSPSTGTAAPFGTAAGWGNPVDVNIAPDGNVAYLGIGSGEIREIVYLGPRVVGPFFTVGDFVQQQYTDLLGRPADSGGLAYWSGAIVGGALTPGAMIESFMQSDEFDQVGPPIARLYSAFLARLPDYDGLSFWLQQRRDGDALAHISDTFAESQEFQDTYGTLEIGPFVDLVYHNVLGRDPDAGGRAYWVDQLDRGTMTRGEVMLGFSESAEYRAAQYGSVNTVLAFAAMLQRAPDDDGYAFWVEQLDDGLPLRDMAGVFVGSDEYLARFT